MFQAYFLCCSHLKLHVVSFQVSVSFWRVLLGVAFNGNRRESHASIFYAERRRDSDCGKLIEVLHAWGSVCRFHVKRFHRFGEYYAGR